MNIELLTLSEVTAIDGEEGNFQVKIRKSPRFVDMEKCIGCGACASICPKVYEMGDDMKAHAKQAKTSESCAKEGADSCPTQAIKLGKA